jgi:hypothetical protein
MGEGSGPCRKQAISSRGTQNDGCESNQVIVSCNLAVAITAEPPLHLECKCVCRENGYKRHGQQFFCPFLTWFLLWLTNRALFFGLNG